MDRVISTTTTPKGTVIETVRRLQEHRVIVHDDDTVEHVATEWERTRVDGALIPGGTFLRIVPIADPAMTEPQRQAIAELDAAGKAVSTAIDDQAAAQKLAAEAAVAAESEESAKP